MPCRGTRCGRAGAGQIVDKAPASIENAAQEAVTHAGSRHRLQQRDTVATAHAGEISVSQKQRFLALKTDDGRVDRNALFAVNAANGAERRRETGRGDRQSDDPHDRPVQSERQDRLDLFGDIEHAQS